MSKCLAKKILELARSQYGFRSPYLGIDETGAVSVRESGHLILVRIWSIGAIGKITYSSARERMAWNAQ